jgi:hypothetical protein
MLSSAANEVTPAHCTEVAKTWNWGLVNHHNGRASLGRIAKANNRTKALYDFFANFTGFQE